MAGADLRVDNPQTLIRIGPNDLVAGYPAGDAHGGRKLGLAEVADAAGGQLVQEEPVRLGNIPRGRRVTFTPSASSEPQGALLDGVLDRVGDAAIPAELGLWALDGHDARGVLVLTVAATTGALLSMASKDRAAALGLLPAPERALGWLLGGRDGRLLLVAVGAILGAPVAALAATTATSALSLGLQVAFVRRPSA